MRMNRREFLKLGGIGAALNGIGRLVASASSKNRPNIVLCMADDQGWGDMAYNGHPVLKTPNFDDLAATGLRFDRFYAAAPVCSPTRGSVLTGRHPNRFGCCQWGFPLRPQEVTIAEVLKKAGYVTGHAAWLDWPWKLPRVAAKGRVKIELYNLTDDPQESSDFAARRPHRTDSMRGQLEAWLLSVVQSWNGKDYG